MALLLLGTLTAAALVRSPNAMSLLYCGANQTRTDATVLALGQGGSPLPVPIAGVVTGWTVVGGSTPRQFEQRLQVFRRVDGPVNFFLAVAESRAEVAPDGPRGFFKTRIPVEGGDLFALRGTTKTFVCDSAVGVTSGLHEGPTPIGSSHEFKAEEGLGVPLDVIVEPDEDRDGYGDLTQDRCARVSMTQDGCPAVKLRIEEALARKRSILLRVTVATKTEVSVHGETTYSERSPGQGVNSLVTELIDGGAKAVRPGRVADVEVKLPKRLVRHLRERARPLRIELNVHATSVAGRSVDRDLTVWLQGQKG